MATVTPIHRKADTETRPLVVTSIDSHIGPRLKEELWSYCPKKYLPDLEAFDAVRQANRVQRSQLFPGEDAQAVKIRRLMSGLLKTAAHYDMNARLHDMDADGVAAEVIFHSSNGEPIPFCKNGTDINYEPPKENLQLLGVGMHMFNQWLADACQTAPDRLIGAAVAPMWDPAAAAKEVEWAARAGLRAVSFPPMRDGIPPYDWPEWEPYWAACAANDMAICTHGGGVTTQPRGLPHEFAITMVELGSWLPRRALPRLLFSGVFERYPNLKFILAEQNPDWWVAAGKEYDAAWLAQHWQISPRAPRKPSEYMAENVFIGDSFMAHFEAADAVENGYVDNMLWGSDRLHAEGTYQYEGADDPATNATRLSLRYCFRDIPAAETRKMIGSNGVRVLGLDEAKLQAVADRIRAPSLKELATPIPAIPDYGGIQAFRSVAWGA